MENNAGAHQNSMAWSRKEYAYLRLEVIERVKILHGLITLAVLLYLPLFIALLWLVLRDAPPAVVDVFLLFIPIIYASLLFNYQANQMTLERVSNYLNHLIKESRDEDRTTLTWDDYYGQQKERYRLTSFLKVTPLISPMLIPLILLTLQRGISGKTASWLLILDLFLLLLVLINFRYKWR